MVCFIHRPEYYLRSGEDAEGNDIRGLAEFIIAKHRSGSVGDVKMRFRSMFARFENWDEGTVSGGEVRSRLGDSASGPFAKTAAATVTAGDPITDPFAGGSVNLASAPSDTPF